MLPKIITGGNFKDTRGVIRYNNNFDYSLIKRMYTIENNDVSFERGWQGHKIEKRWFSVIQGCFDIQVIKIDNWEKPSKKLEIINFTIDSETMDILYVPNGYITNIKSLQKGSKLLSMSDYRLNEIIDDYRLAIEYFK